jgi:hypothetical protein
VGKSEEPEMAELKMKVTAASPATLVDSIADQPGREGAWPVP